MYKRPLSVTLISVVLIATGAIGLALHLRDFRAQNPFQYDIVWASLLQFAAIVSGVYLLRASNWARWISLAWIAFHVILSLFHARFELVVHILVGAAFTYFLFRARASKYFRRAAI
jgi:hypothetical protein